jgi:hypothetical protein
MIVDTYFQMNFKTKDYKQIKKYRDKEMEWFGIWCHWMQIFHKNIQSDSFVLCCTNIHRIRTFYWTFLKLAQNAWWWK